MLTWTSDIWGKLMGPYGSGENVPVLLQQLTQKYDQEIADELFEEYLFHQNTIYTVTYAAVPYLVQIACSTQNPEVRHNLFITCGVIEASRNDHKTEPFPSGWTALAEQVGASICEEIYSEYIKAISEIALLWEEVFAYAHTLDDSEKHYVLVADAAYRGSHQVANMLMTFVDEYIVACPLCKQESYLWPNDKHRCIEAFAQDPIFEEGQKAYPVIPIAKFLDVEQVILSERVIMIDEKRLARDLPYLAGEVNCPSCGMDIQIWRALLEHF
ncbi:hypothetical protein [Metasolibacillus meyeri]|uniref:hypothetical protein n=1 Tax=Metasolibacillus meyeri TaxID=1071052 RepID=UPI000D2F86A5|nr:hypothetical protein [Metasolibacillus meyeri]